MAVLVEKHLQGVFEAARLPGRDQDGDDSLVSHLVRLVLHFFQLLRLDHPDGRLHQVPDHRFHIPAHITHFRKFGRFHLDEGGADQLRQAAGDLRLPHARGADHQDVFGHHLVPAALPAATSGGSGCGGRWRPPAWLPAGRQCICPARRQSGAALTALVCGSIPRSRLYLLHDNVLIGKHADLPAILRAASAISRALMSGA